MACEEFVTRETNCLVNEEIGAAASEHRQRLQTAVEEIADVKRRLEKLYDALETGKVSLDDLAPHIQQLRLR